MVTGERSDQEMIDTIRGKLNDLVVALNEARARSVTVTFSIDAKTPAEPLELTLFKAIREYD